MIQIQANEIILFNGDSITDALRNREDVHSLAGYSKRIAERIARRFPNGGAQCYNRGVGGDTSAQLLSRLGGELEEIRPTLVSLLIGVNDTWRRFDSGEIISAETFEKNVETALKLVKTHTDRIVLIEPFLLDVDPGKREFRGDLDPKIEALRGLARKYRTEYIPMDGIFAEACVKKPPDYYSYDGVHPTSAGHALIAREWLRRVKMKQYLEE